ncbi:MAG: response regulator, partial [Saprospiraceae bacterium]|nr:response regulator [Saprospiraceae bacterium]
PVRHAAAAAELPEARFATPTTPTAPLEADLPALGSSGLPVALVIEDNVDLRGFIVQSIASHWQVLEAADGEEGIQKAVDALPDLVLSDVMMPGKDGYELCHVLKNMELTAHIPVILLTAKSGMDAKLKGLRIGADDYLTKPFHTEELLTRMGNLIELRRKLRFRYGQQPSEPADPEVGEFLSPPDKEFLRRLNDTLEQHLTDETLGVEEFAQKMFISRVQLHRKLKALTDQSPTEFIRDYRLDRAMEMLKKREGLVNEIAAMVGFSNEKYFSTVFKEKFGLSPSKV